MARLFFVGVVACLQLVFAELQGEVDVATGGLFLMDVPCVTEPGPQRGGNVKRYLRGGALVVPNVGLVALVTYLWHNGGPHPWEPKPDDPHLPEPVPLPLQPATVSAHPRWPLVSAFLAVVLALAMLRRRRKQDVGPSQSPSVVPLVPSGNPGDPLAYEGIIQKREGSWSLSGSSGRYSFDASTGWLSGGGEKLGRFICKQIQDQPLKLPVDSYSKLGSNFKDKILSSEIMKEIQNPQNAGALFVLPSQLNGAEYPSHKHVAKSVEDYKSDNTGGPRGQLAVHPAAAQFILDNAAGGGGSGGINAIDQILKQQELQKHLELVNGYLKVHDVDGPTSEIEKQLLKYLNTLRPLIMEDVPANGLTPDKKGFAKSSNHKVGLVYASAVPVDSYLNQGGNVEFQTKVAELILIGQYHGALRYAAEHQRHKGVTSRRKVFLMPLGGGVFSNPWDIIAKSMAKAIQLLDDDSLSRLDIHALTWSGAPSEEQKLKILINNLISWPTAKSSALVVVKSYGILGRNNNGPKADPPSEDTVLVDPAGLPFIRGDRGPKDAKGAAQANYQWLEISEAESFPAEVKEAITEECQAKYYAYAGGTKKCIHVVGPDLRTSDRKSLTLNEAVDKLATAYRNVFEEFCAVGLRKLRLLPISGGIFSGPFKEDLPKMTAQAVQAAYEQLSEDKKQHIKNSSIDMCIFMESEFDLFASAFGQANEKAPHTLQVPGGKTQMFRMQTLQPDEEPEPPNMKRGITEMSDVSDRPLVLDQQTEMFRMQTTEMASLPGESPRRSPRIPMKSVEEEAEKVEEPAGNEEVGRKVAEEAEAKKAEEAAKEAEKAKKAKEAAEAKKAEEAAKEAEEARKAKEAADAKKAEEAAKEAEEARKAKEAADAKKAEEAAKEAEEARKAKEAAEAKKAEEAAKEAEKARKAKEAAEAKKKAEEAAKKAEEARKAAEEAEAKKQAQEARAAEAKEKEAEATKKVEEARKAAAKAKKEHKKKESFLGSVEGEKASQDSKKGTAEPKQLQEERSSTPRGQRVSTKTPDQMPQDTPRRGLNSSLVGNPGQNIRQLAHALEMNQPPTYETPTSSQPGSPGKGSGTPGKKKTKAAGSK